MYRELQIERIESTAVRLRSRIEKRFPNSGLSKVCEELQTVVEEADEHCEEIAKPMWWLRGVVAGIIVLMLSFVVYTFTSFDPELEFKGQFFEATEALVSELVFLGAAIFFLVTIEIRVKRRRALAALNEYRALAHVIDMHQLTKDPVRIKRRSEGEEEWQDEIPPPQVLNSIQLQRYLDYCSEMLSLLGKTAALYAQNMNDEVVLAAVNEIEQLCTGLSNKIWQKITNVRMIFDPLEPN
ncbi:MAG: hypothetical protein QNK37_22865 [Acidobacteriota bacterium]|nr:hypothetical protein [Acidobacteriota bacterium]